MNKILSTLVITAFLFGFLHLTIPNAYADDMKIDQSCTQEGWSATINNTDGNPLENVRVGTLDRISSSSPEESFYTDENGHVVIPPASITGFVKVTKGGYNDQKFSLSCDVSIGFLTYQNSKEGFQIQYPSNWVKDVLNDPFVKVVFISPAEHDSDVYFEMALVGTEDLPPNTTLDEYTQLSKSNISGATAQVLESSRFTLSGQPAHKFFYIDKGFEDVQILSAWTIKDSKAYFLGFIASPETFSKYQKTFEKMLDSFEFSDNIEIPIGIEEFPISQFSVYENTAKGITIKYPPNWQKVEPEAGQGIDVILQSPLESVSDVFVENSVLVTQKSPGLSFQDYTQVALNNFESRPTVEILDDSPTTLGGIPAHQVIYTETTELGIEMKSWIIWTIANDSVYTVGFGSEPKSFDAYESIFQNIRDSVEITELILPIPVSGKYSNSEAGIEMQLPEGWQGIEQQKEDLTMVVVSPGITIQPFAQGSQMSDKLEFSVLTIIIGKYSSIAAEISSAVSEDTQCTSETVQITEINSMKTQESLSDCQDPIMGTIKGLEYVFTTKDDTIVVAYGAISSNPDKTYDENIEQFIESLGTLKIQNTLDLSDPFSYAKTLEMTASKESVTSDGETMDILFASNSTISNVSFNEEENSLTFEPKGQSGTSGITEVYLGNVLDEPYAVSLGNNQIDDFVVVHDKTNGQTSINFEYKHPTGLVTVTVAQEKTAIPDWVRGNAEWWAQGAIGDSDFVSGIQFLIKEGIMTIPETAQGTTSDDSQEIPSWIKNNADWWAQGLISDDDFLKGIQYLVEQGIMVV